MLNKRNILNLFFIIIILIAGIGIGISIDINKNVGGEREEKSSKSAPDVILASLMFDYGNGKVKTYNDIELKQGQSVFSLLERICTDNNLELKYNPPKDSFGVFITNINGITNDNNSNKWWTYWVNNKMAMEAADQFILQDGDIIEWKYGAQIEFK